MTSSLKISIDGKPERIREQARRCLCLGLALTWSAIAPIASAQQDAARGRVLYETYCSGCHYEKLHERPRARSLVKSQADLRTQVMRWAPQTMHSFSSEEIEAVVSHLNRSHYKLDR